MRRDSSGLSWRGPRPGPIASAVTEDRQSRGTSWPEWSRRWAMARPGCRSDSGGSDLIEGGIGRPSARLMRAGGALVSAVGPSEARAVDGRAVDFVGESDRAQLSEIVQRVRDGRLRTNIGTVSSLDDAVAAFNTA